MRKNLWLKAAAVALAVVLWLFVISRSLIDVSMRSQVEFVNVPEGLYLVVPESSSSVAIGLRGPERIVKGLGPHNVKVTVDLSGFSKGAHHVGIDKDRIGLPMFVRVLSIDPAVVTVSLEEAIRRSVPVKPDVAGSPEAGYRVLRMKVTPGSVEVQGAKSKVQKLQWVATEPVDISGASETVTREVGVLAPAGLQTQPGKVTLEVTIEKERT